MHMQRVVKMIFERLQSIHEPFELPFRIQQDKARSARKIIALCIFIQPTVLFTIPKHCSNDIGEYQAVNCWFSRSHASHTFQKMVPWFAFCMNWETQHCKTMHTWSKTKNTRSLHSEKLCLCPVFNWSWLSKQIEPFYTISITNLQRLVN